MPQITAEYIQQLAREERHGELFQAFQELLKHNPGNPSLLHNASLSAFRSGHYAEAIDYLGQLKAQVPQDFNVRAKLIQAYEADQDDSARDAERDELFALYNQVKADPQTPKRYCRDEFEVGDLTVQAFEYFELLGEMAKRYDFYIFQAREPKPDYLISFGSYEQTNQYMQESGRLQPGQRAFHLDEYRPGGVHRSLAFCTGEPPYHVVKNVVLDVLRQS